MWLISSFNHTTQMFWDMNIDEWSIVEFFFLSMFTVFHKLPCMADHDKTINLEYQLDDIVKVAQKVDFLKLFSHFTTFIKPQFWPRLVQATVYTSIVDLAVIFTWDTMNYFFIVKVVVASSQQVTCSISLPHDVTVNTHCHVTKSG